MMDFKKLNISALPNHIQCDQPIIKQLIEANNEEEIKLIMDRVQPLAGLHKTSLFAQNDLEHI